MGLQLLRTLRRKASFGSRSAPNNRIIDEEADEESIAEKTDSIKVENCDETSSDESCELTRCDLKDNLMDIVSVSTTSTMDTNDSRSEHVEGSEKRHVEGDERRESIDNILLPSPPVAPLQRQDCGNDQVGSTAECSELMFPVNATTEEVEDFCTGKPPMHRSRHSDDCDALLKERRHTSASNRKRHRRSSSDSPDLNLHIYHKKLTTLYEEKVKSNSDVDGVERDIDDDASNDEGYEGSDDKSDTDRADEINLLQKRWNCALKMMHHSIKYAPSQDFYNTLADVSRN
uniref:Uncharacterized protein n=1 Tax=Ditylum brightwellii TaxID=49249 RepID=A0A7S4WJB4_9STRA